MVIVLFLKPNSSSLPLVPRVKVSEQQGERCTGLFAASCPRDRLSHRDEKREEERDEKRQGERMSPTLMSTMLPPADTPGTYMT